MIMTKIMHMHSTTICAEINSFATSISKKQLIRLHKGIIVNIYCVSFGIADSRMLFPDFSLQNTSTIVAFKSAIKNTIK